MSRDEELRIGVKLAFFVFLFLLDTGTVLVVENANSPRNPSSKRTVGGTYLVRQAAGYCSIKDRRLCFLSTKNGGAGSVGEAPSKNHNHRIRMVILCTVFIWGLDDCFPPCCRWFWFLVVVLRQTWLRAPSPCWIKTLVTTRQTSGRVRKNQA
jgi:hypothetical protein